MTKIEKRLSITFTVLALLWCCLIYWYSSRVANLSDYDSSSVFDLFLKLFYPKYRGFSDVEKLMFQDKYIYLFRKLAHFTEYAVLGFFIYPALSFLKPKAKQIVWSFIYCLLFAMSDEYHQLFVAGREGKITDVAIDFVGAAFGICAILLIFYIVNKIAQKKTKV